MPQQRPLRAVGSPAADGDGQGPDLFELIRAWASYLEVSNSASGSTITNYRRALIRFVADELVDLREVTETEVVDYLGTLNAKGAMRGLVLRALKSFYRWALARGIVVVDPTAHLRIGRGKLAPAPSLSRGDLEAVLRAAEDIDPRARPAIELLYFTGARVGSLCALMPNDFRIGEDGSWSVRFDVAKGDRPYEVPLAPEGVAAAERLLGLAGYAPLRGRRRDNLVGVGRARLEQWVRQAGERAGVRCYPHLLRHTFATRLAENPNVDLRSWIELMNHTDGSQFRRYAAASSARLREAVQGL